MSLEIIVPDQYFGEVLRDLNARRGEVKSTEKRATAQIIRAIAPLAEMFGYVNALRSLTQGRGTFSMEFSIYQEVPEEIQSEILFKVRGY